MLMIRPLNRIATQALRCLSTSTEPLLSHMHQHACVVTLNRPKALNSLNTEMCVAMANLLTHPEHAVMIVKGAGDKAFCAGGDVKQIWQDGQTLKDDARLATGAPGLTTSDFFREEYIMNHQIGIAAAPQVSLWDGIVMGGGVGISVHGRFRVATEKTVFAMPETGIGLFPDVGSSNWLHTLGPVGVYVGLTGARLKAADLVDIGIATHFIPKERLALTEDKIIHTCTTNPTANVAIINEILTAQSATADASKAVIGPNKEAINRTFDKQTVEEIIESLRSEDSEWGRKTLETMLKMSPTSLKVTLKQIQEGARLGSLKECLQMEYRIAQGFMRPGSDFYEGIRALLVDKDNAPRWNPSEISAVSDAAVNSYFAAIQHELVL